MKTDLSNLVGVLTQPLCRAASSGTTGKSVVIGRTGRRPYLGKENRRTFPGNFFFGDSRNGFFSMLITPLSEFKNVLQIYSPLGPSPVKQ